MATGQGSIIVPNNDATFQAELEKAGSKLVVVDFHATWCGPCKTIAPVFQQLSLKHTDAVFIKVDVDDLTGTSEKYNVTAMPTFILMKSKQVIDTMKGADAKKLKELIEKHSGGVTEEDTEVPGMADLVKLINSSGSNCLNEDDEYTYKNVLADTDTKLKSDCDEQLMLSLSFNQSVKVHSLKIRAPNDGTGPKTIKIFVNQPNAVDFDQGERMEGQQKLVLEESDITGEKLIPLRFVKFQNVTNMVLFVVDNQGGDELTVMNYIKFIGSPCGATNMNEFKRVAGKAGESH